ncbi:hypothetical protein CASFOL_028721 [Castilleja foliolosa]|uniref:Transposase n=1 Tax=Castilleja foliolosa TaxID=1961234 RepID=A0ABD3CBZ1_9LAMI
MANQFNHGLRFQVLAMYKESLQRAYILDGCNCQIRAQWPKRGWQCASHATVMSRWIYQ